MRAEKISRSCPENDWPADLEFQTRVFVPTTRASAKVRPPSRRIEMLTTHTAKGRFSPSVFKECVIAPVIVKPQAEKEHSDDEKENDCGEDKIHLWKQCRKWCVSANPTGQVQQQIKAVIYAIGFILGKDDGQEN